MCCVVCSYLYSIRWSFPVTVCCVCWRRTQHCAETSPPSQPRPRNSFRWVHGGPLKPRETFLSIIFHDIRPEEPVLANRLCLPFETTAVRILHAGGDRRGDPDGRVGDEAARIRSDQKVPPNHSSERFSFELEMDQSHPQYSNREWSPPFSNSNILGEQIPSACLCLRRASRADRAGCVGHRPR